MVLIRILAEKLRRMKEILEFRKLRAIFKVFIVIFRQFCKFFSFNLRSLYIGTLYPRERPNFVVWSQRFQVSKAGPEIRAPYEKCCNYCRSIWGLKLWLDFCPAHWTWVDDVSPELSKVLNIFCRNQMRSPVLKKALSFHTNVSGAFKKARPG